MISQSSDGGVGQHIGIKDLDPSKMTERILP
jgi:hypothetical protein